MRFDDFYKTIYKQLKSKKFRITPAGVKSALLEHPDYPSMQAIADYFADMDIANTVVRIDFEQLCTAVTEAEVIVLIRDEEGDNLLWITKIENGNICFANAKPEAFEEFRKKWKEIALLFQTDETKKEENYAMNINKENVWKRIFSIVIAGFLCLSLAYVVKNHFTMFSILTLFPKYGGFLFASLLVAMELGFKIPLTEKLCSVSTNKGCEKVAHSRMSSITENIKLADLGLIYFTTTFLFLLTGNTCLLGYIALLCIPLILFSVIYQTFVLKVYCPLCLGVMGMLICDITIYGWNGIYSNPESVIYESVVFLVGLGGIVTGFWLGIKKITEEKNNYESYKYRYIRLHRNPERIRMLLESLPEAALNNTNCDILLGDDKPKLIITEVMSPFCGPCGSSMQKIIELLHLFNEKVQIRILFTNNKGDKEKNQEIISHLLTLSKVVNQDRMIRALSDWFEKTDYTIWSKKYPLKEGFLTEKEITDYFETLKTYQIKYTPTLFIEKKQIPPDLSFNNLRYYIDDTLT